MQIFRTSYALVYYFATFLLSAAITAPIVLFVPRVGFEETLIGDVVALFATVIAMFSPTVQQRIEVCLANISERLNGSEENAEALKGGPWLKLGGCFAAYYLFSTTLFLRHIFSYD